MIIWLSQVGLHYYKITWVRGKFIMSSGYDGEWTKEGQGPLEVALSWIVNSDLERDVLIGEDKKW